MSNTRLNAIQSLIGIFSKGSRPKESLETAYLSLDRRDRAFVMEIVYGVLRHRDAIDWVLKDFLKNPAKLGDFTLNNLRTALYQIFFMRVPDWAVVNESVEIEKITSSEQAAGRPSLVNGVLRNILRRKDAIVFPIPFADTAQNISVNTSHPIWMVRRWLNRLGEDETALLAEANNRIPNMTIRVNTLRTSREELLERLSQNGIAAEPTPFSPDGIILKEAGAYAELSFIHGLFVVQGEASQLVTYLLDPQPGERILDACAAPGGKTSHIAQRMNDKGEVVATEKDPHRITRLRDNISALGTGSVRIINKDILDSHDMGAFDRILIDAPCSATGVIGKNPDVKYRLKPKDLAGYKSRQIELLKAASLLLKKNGRLVYSVCSIEPEEGEQVINEFLKTKGEFSIIDIDALFLKNFIHEGVFRTYPHKHNMDGFFGVSLCKKS